MKKKLKAVTFSYDDAVTQDNRLIEIFNKYGLKCTFNINSGLLATGGSLVREDVTVAWAHPRACELKRIYEGHEVAAHTITHPCLTRLSDEEVIREIEGDRLALSEIMGYEVVGMAYPGDGGPSFDDRVVELIKANTGIMYARTTVSTHDFKPQTDLLRFKPTAYHHRELDKCFQLAKEFIEKESDTPEIFYIWGHAYEFDIHNDWARMEELCKLLSGRDDIFYGTNKEVLLCDEWYS